MCEHDFAVGVTFLALFRESRRTRTASWTPHGVSPDDGRKPAPPTSTRALAESLDLPYDTVRRHLRKLRALGWCESGAEGVFVPRNSSFNETLRTAAEQLWRLSRDFVMLSRRLEGAGLPSDPVLPRDSRFQVARVAIEYFVDSLSMARRRLRLSPIECVVLRTIASRDLRTLAELAGGPGGAREQTSDGAAPPRRPISVYAVSKTLALPYETVRRTANQLIEAGWAVRAGDRGLFVPAPIWATQASVAYIAECALLTAAFLARLAQIDAQMAAAGRLAPSKPI
jgi:DNA-binding transcriptional ArsR family regulator